MALLEQQSLMTLAEVAERCEAAGIAPRAMALTSLPPCPASRLSLALYGYGPLDGLLRLRHGGVDEMLPAPWAHGDEEKLIHLMQTALEMKAPLEVVAGRAPAWTTHGAGRRPSTSSPSSGGTRPS